MKANVGTIDRGLRMVLGIAIIVLGIYFQSWWGVIGVIPLFTAFVKWCPAYVPFGLSTCATDTKNATE